MINSSITVTLSWSCFLISLLLIGRLRTQMVILLSSGAPCGRSAPSSDRKEAIICWKSIIVVVSLIHYAIKVINYCILTHVSKVSIFLMDNHNVHVLGTDTVTGTQYCAFITFTQSTHMYSHMPHVTTQYTYTYTHTCTFCFFSAAARDTFLSSYKIIKTNY